MGPLLAVLFSTMLPAPVRREEVYCNCYCQERLP
jgi:hypothetical protein